MTELIIDTFNLDPFCMSNMTEKSITRDIAERLVFAKMSNIIVENVIEYYTRLQLVYSVSNNDAIMNGMIFSDDGEVDGYRKFMFCDFASRIGVETNLVESSLDEFFKGLEQYLIESEKHGVENLAMFSYEDLEKMYLRKYKYNCGLFGHTLDWLFADVINHYVDVCNEDVTRLNYTRVEYLESDGQ